MVDKLVLLDFKGNLTYNDISEITRQLEQCMVNQNEPIGIYKKLLTITIEALENILKYSDKLAKDISIFTIAPAKYQLIKNSHSYEIKATNPIRKDDVGQLKEKIDYINTLNKKDIKQLYNTTIANGVFSEQGGAGLGMLEILKASDHKIGYIFEEIDPFFLNFSIIIELKYV